MTPQPGQLFLCSCNSTAPIDAVGVASALGLGEAPVVHTMLCQKQLASFGQGAAGDVVVGCTQEARLFDEIATEAARTQTVRFVNLRENGGWSPEARGATPKLAALLAQAMLPDPDPVPAVSYQSQGQVLIVGPLDVALRWADALQERLGVTVLFTRTAPGTELPVDRAFPIYSGRITALNGWLGAFEAQWQQENPIELDLSRCKSHRACVAACGAIGAIDFTRRDPSRTDRFDLVLDLGETPALQMRVPPQGYLAPGTDLLAQVKAVAALVSLTGEFEKP